MPHEAVCQSLVARSGLMSDPTASVQPPAKGKMSMGTKGVTKRGTAGLASQSAMRYTWGDILASTNQRAHHGQGRILWPSVASAAQGARPDPGRAGAAG